ncbi:hypothetical protein GCM10010421_23240 [Streptomyces glaucus]|uniref:Uncharacterized protein n=1 Tax=Streptomyces glaucus TaxID=284029 RepID=A0ABN3JL01_9ACTN
MDVNAVLRVPDVGQVDPVDLADVHGLPRKRQYDGPLLPSDRRPCTRQRKRRPQPRKDAPAHSSVTATAEPPEAALPRGRAGAYS